MQIFYQNLLHPPYSVLLLHIFYYTGDFYILLCAFYLIVLQLLSGGASKQSSSLSLKNINNDADINKVKDALEGIKAPDDISEIKKWKDDCLEKKGPEVMKEIEV